MTDKPDILKRIEATKWEEVRARQSTTSARDLQLICDDLGPARGFMSALVSARDAGRPGIIAEIKKASPSKGVIREHFDPVEIAVSYERGGASCLSVLTDESYFQGADRYLSEARLTVSLPVLRKDFVVDEYQVLESRAIGADCILLIVAILPLDRLQALYTQASELGMDVLVEVHDEAELELALQVSPTIVGINNRDLRTFEVDLATTWRLQQIIDRASPTCHIVTESGIHEQEDVAAMQARGINSFLVGEAFMRADDPGVKLGELFFGEQPG